MRILIVTTDYLPNISGIATLCYEQAAGLAAAGHDVCVLTTVPGAACYNADDQFEVIVHTGIKKPVLRLWSLTHAVSEAMAAFRPDLLWCANYRGFGMPSMLLGRCRKIPYGIYIHGTEIVSEKKTLPRCKVFRSVLNNAAVVVTNSVFTSDLLRDSFSVPGVPVTPGVFPPPGAPQELTARASAIRHTWISKTGARDDVLIFISSCRIAPEKGLDLVLKAIAMLPSHIKKRILYIMGGAGPSEEAYQKLAIQMGIEKQVLFNGVADRHELPATLKAADVYLQPSQPVGDYIEGFGISFLEAQAMGLPCIASNWAGTPEAINSGVTGLLVPTGSIEAIAAAITRNVEDTDWRILAGAEAVRWAAGNSWTNHSSSLEPFLMKAADPSYVEELL